MSINWFFLLDKAVVGLEWGFGAALGMLMLVIFIKLVDYLPDGKKPPEKPDLGTRLLFDPRTSEQFALVKGQVYPLTAPPPKESPDAP